MHEKLINQYPNVKFPQASIHFTEKIMRGGVAKRNAASGHSLIDERLKILQEYLQELALIPAIKESSHFKAFIGIDEHFPEFCNEYEQSHSAALNQNNLFERAQPSIGNGGFSFKIMNDLLGTSIGAAQQRSSPRAPEH